MKITFIQTGGTIDKDYPRTTKGWAFEIGEPAFKRILQRLNPTFEAEFVLLLQKDSLEITQQDRQLLYDTCLQNDSSKIIITHGTDTLIETAKFLADKGIPQKVIVLTGAMRPERFRNSDADVHLGLAIGAVNVLKEGVYVAMQGQIIPANRAKRDLETGRFTTPSKSFIIPKRAY